MYIQKVSNIDSIDKFANIIYNNFNYLKNQPGINFSKTEIINCLTSPELIAWYLLDDNNNITGYLIGTTKDIGDGRYVYFIDYFYIINKYRNKGYGTKMLSVCINYIRNMNIKFIMLISKINSKAYKMYNKIGFTQEPLMKIDNPNFKI
jgi:ribosomal protein S18 acetylase RimI-like enzyme